MLAEFWKLLTQKADEQAEAQLDSSPTVLPSEMQTDPRAVRYWNHVEKKVGSFERETAIRKAKVTTLDSLLAFVRYQKASDNASMTIWVDRFVITVVCDDDDRRDRVTLSLESTPLWKVLNNLSSQPLVAQQAAILLLRQEFAPFDVNALAISAVKNLKLKRTEDTESTANPGNVRMSRSIHQEAAGGQILPESLGIRVWPFTGVIPETDEGTPADGYPILVWLDIDFDKLAIRFDPDKAAMVQALELEQARLVEQLRESTADLQGVHIFAGDAGIS